MMIDTTDHSGSNSQVPTAKKEVSVDQMNKSGEQFNQSVSQTVAVENQSDENNIKEPYQRTVTDATFIPKIKSEDTS